MARDLAALLVAEKLLGPDDLARIERARLGKPLWAALLEGELLTGEQLFHVLEAEGHFPSVSEEEIARARPPERLLEAWPAAQAVAGGVLPLALSPDGREAEAAMADPSDAALLAAFRAALSVEKVRARLAPVRPLREALQRAYGGAGASVELDPTLLRPAPPPAPPPEDEKTPRVRDDLAALERWSRALVETVEALAVELEQRVGARPRAAELARLARRVGREIGCAPAAVEEIGVVALLAGVHRALLLADGPTGGGAVALVETLGWPAACTGGLAHSLRALTAAASPFGRAGAGAPPLGTRIVGVCADYLELKDEAARAAEAPPDRETVSQLLRAGPASSAIVDALLKILEQREPQEGAHHHASR